MRVNFLSGLDYILTGPRSEKGQVNAGQQLINKLFKELSAQLLKAISKFYVGKLLDNLKVIIKTKKAQNSSEIVNEIDNLIEKTKKISTNKIHTSKFLDFENLKNQGLNMIKQFKTIASSPTLRIQKLFVQTIPLLIVTMTTVTTMLKKFNGLVKIENFVFFQVNNNVSKNECDHPCKDCSNTTFDFLGVKQNAIPVS